MTPRHHPDPQELLAYATGHSEECLSALLACHLTLCPACREQLGFLEALGGLVLEGLEGNADAVERTAQGLEPGSRPPIIAPQVLSPERRRQRFIAPQAPADVARWVPRPLHAYLGNPARGFEPLAPGIDHIPLRLKAGGRAVQLLRFQGGYVIPPHGHSGLEWFLVFRGGALDNTTGEHFRRGDVGRRNEADVHSLSIDQHQPCIAVLANFPAPFP